MVNGRLRVTRKAFTRKDGTRVKKSTFFIQDRGNRGRGPKVIPPLTGSPLGVKFSNKASTRRRKEIALAKRIGERKVVGKLGAIATLNKNTNPTLSRKARSDQRFIAERFIGKKRVRSPRGLSTTRRRR